MDKEKQIEEMTKITCSMYCRNRDKKCAGVQECDMKCLQYQRCEALYNAGYRKQSEGEWIEQGECWKTLRCSVCGHTTDTIFDKTPFCPNCGAKMKGGGE